jgi:GDPmannose 4,6-dehydratase
MKAVIFGASGQDGFYLTKLLHRERIEAVGVCRSRCDLIGDVADRELVEDLIRTHEPDFIFHLAANSTTRHQAVFDNHAAVSTGALNILEAVYQRRPSCRVFLSGSAMQFKNNGLPIDESTPFEPLSAYAVSRIHSVYAGRYYRSLGLKVYVGYFFNHDSRLRDERHINQKIVIAAKERRKIEIGDTSVRKEFGFAGDVVEAIWRLVNQDRVAEAVIGTGVAHSLDEWLHLCFGAVNEDWGDYVTPRKDFVPEYRVLVSNPALMNSLGWEAKVDIRGLARMMMEEEE